jgi:hypothetical protein
MVRERERERERGVRLNLEEIHREEKMDSRFGWRQEKV